MRFDWCPQQEAAQTDNKLMTSDVEGGQRGLMLVSRSKIFRGNSWSSPVNRTRRTLLGNIDVLHGNIDVLLVNINVLLGNIDVLLGNLELLLCFCVLCVWCERTQKHNHFIVNTCVAAVLNSFDVKYSSISDFPDVFFRSSLEYKSLKAAMTSDICFCDFKNEN